MGKARDRIAKLVDKWGGLGARVDIGLSQAGRRRCDPISHRR